MNRYIYILFSVVTTFLVLVILSNFTSLNEISELIKRIDKKLLLIFMLLSFVMSLFRMLRYRYLLLLAGHQTSSIRLFLVTIVRNLFSDLLPARIGTVIYVYLVKTRLKLPISAASSSFAVSFLFDIISILPIILILVLVSSSENFSKAPIILSALLLFIASLFIYIFLPKILKILKRAFSNAPNLKKKAEDFLDDTSKDLIKTFTLPALVKLFILSLLIRISKYSQLYILFLALMLPNNYSLGDLPAVESILGICAAEISASLPISGIAGFGLYEGTWTLVFNLIGLPKNLAASSGVSHHLITQVWGYGLGILALVLLLIPCKSHKD